MCLGCYHTLSIAWVLQADKHQRNHILSCPVSPVLPHWTRTDRDCRQGGQFSLNIILCVWKPHLLNTSGVLNTTIAHSICPPNWAIVSSEARKESQMRTSPTTLTSFYLLCLWARHRNDLCNTFSSAVFRGVARNELQGSLLEIQEFISPGISPVKQH